MAKFKLKLMERITLPIALRFLTQGGFAKFQTAENIKKKVSITSEEIELLNIRDMPDRTTRWDSSKDVGVDIDFTQSELEVIREALSEMDNKQVVSWDFIPLFNIFMNK